MIDRTASINRITNETKINLKLNLDGSGIYKGDTKIGFFDHMLNLFAFNAGIDLDLKADGDLNVCDHHTIEDAGIALGQTFLEAIKDKAGIKRYGTFFIPMDESMAAVSIDICDRPYLVFDCTFNREKVGDMSTEMVKEFFNAFAMNARVTLHLKVLYGENDHHKIEALFKAFGRALKEAKSIDKMNNGIPSTKGKL